ncbi:MAG: acyl-CoA dehydrogenase [Pseudomonadota bacterium]
MSMIVNRRDLSFLMYETLGLEEILKSERYADYDKESVDAMLDLAQTIAEEKFLPSAGLLDANEPEFVDGKVRLIPEVGEAIDAYREAGFCTSAYDADVGGMQLPWLVDNAVKGMFSCANGAINSYLFLTQGVANMLEAHGSEELKKRYLPQLVNGEWFGTMCLSEPQAGSSLADIRTKAEPLPDGSYAITGTKMWISAGEHELTENIIHMVLAKVPGGPAGVKGISLFLVPKRRVSDDGSVGESNNIALAGLNHKMGHRGTTNCLLNFGESGECVGYLVGKEHNGLAHMFHMMNEARISVGMGATMSALGGYLYSLDYARQRPQGRPLIDRDPTSPMVMISEHADVKRMLMAQKAYVEGALALMYYCVRLVDMQRLSENAEEQQRLSLLLDLLTPIAKSWPSEYCLEANKLAIQILGGYGYTREFPVERLYRDNRLNHIHEGTWGIHGIDLLGRKVRMFEGAAMTALHAEVAQTVAAASAIPELKDNADQLVAALEHVNKTIEAVSAAKNPELGLANAKLFLDAMGHVVIAWMWLKQGVAATTGLAESVPADTAFYTGKLAAMRYFFSYELPRKSADLDLVASLDATVYELEAEQFTGS